MQNLAAAPAGAREAAKQRARPCRSADKRLRAGGAVRRNADVPRVPRWTGFPLSSSRLRVPRPSHGPATALRIAWPWVGSSAERRQTQRLSQWIEQGTVALRVPGIAAQRLAHLHGAGGVHSALRAVELQAAFLEREVAELQQQANSRLRIDQHLLVHVLVNVRGVQSSPLCGGAVEVAPVCREILEGAGV